MSYKQQFWNDYDESKTETQNIENGAVITSERMNRLERGVVSNFDILDNSKAEVTDLSEYRQKDTAISMADLSEDVKKAMTGDSAVNALVPDMTITPYKTTFITSVNNFNPANTVSGKYVAWDDGTLRNNENYIAHKYIAVFEGEKWNYNHTAQIAFYDTEYKYVSGIQKNAENKPMSFIVPKNAKYMQVSFNRSISDEQKIMLNRGEVLKGFVPFRLTMNQNYLNDIPGESIVDASIEPKKTTFMGRKNIAEQVVVKQGVYARYDNGLESPNAKYSLIDTLIPIEPNTTYTMNHDVQIPFFDYAGNFLSGITGAGVVRARTFTSPTGARFLKANMLAEAQSTFQIEEGSSSTEYESPDIWKIKSEYLPTKNGEGTSDDFELCLPPTLYIVPGMTIEMYNKQVCWTGNINNYHFKWIGDVGVAYERKWSLRATTAMIGTHNLDLVVYDNNLNEVAKGNTKVIIGTYAFPGTKTILNIGDSLSNTTSTDKPWYSKVTQLTSKIRYVGTRGLAVGQMHEGRSGFSAAGYLSEKAYPFENEGVHPFWNPTTKQFDYQYYIDKTGIDADGVQIFLGTNGIALDPTSNANNIRTIVDKILLVRPNVPIFLVHTIYRSNQDGIAKQTSNDGYTASSGVMKLEEDKKVFNLMKRLNNLLKDYNNVVFVPLAHCHDSEYNYGDVLEKVNPRNAKQVSMPKESIHPQDEGYMQFADVFFCMYCAFNNF